MAAIDLNAIRATIEGRLKTEFDTSPTYDVVFHNMPYTPTPSSTWLQCLVSFGDSSYLSQGGTSGSDNLVTGSVFVNIFSGQGVGPGENLTVGKRVRDLYNRVNVSGVRFDPPTGPEVLATPAPEGYFQTQVRMTFDTFEEL
tara:strand:+ start:124 stop:549 length:426 start_codon:yes stop_codon:yes gene_type:complete